MHPYYKYNYMKHLLRSLLLLIITTTVVVAQKKLSNSRTQGSFTYIYKLTDKEAFSIASVGKMVLNDALLHTLVDSFYNVKRNSHHRKLPYGNYLEVKAVKNELVYRLLAENNVNLQFINNRKDFQFRVTDLKGQQLSDVKVTVGKGKVVKYNTDAQLFLAGSGTREKVITVLHNGVNNFFTYEEEKVEEFYRSKKSASFFSRLFAKKNTSGSGTRPVVKAEKERYRGYMVFNKPMYKPLDTVKLKAYLLNLKGANVQNKPLRIELYKEWNGPGVVLATLNPYRDGGYTYDFVLADSLQLKLDRTYKIVLKEQVKKEWVIVQMGSFRYEDYELKSVNFTVRSNKDEHNPGSPISLFFKATDENELAVPDGRVEVVLQASYPLKYHDQKVFVKDTLWKTNITLDPVGETKLVLPDSIFPKADLNFSANFTFLNSNNERRTAYKSLKYVLKNQEIKYDFARDSLHFKYLVKGESVPQKAMLFTNYPNSEQQDSIEIKLPASIKINYNATDYDVKMADGFIDHIFLKDLKPELSIGASQTKDSLRVVVSNPHQVPFWYTIFSGNKTSLKGYTEKLDTTFKHPSDKIVNIKLNYVWAENELSLESSTTYQPNILNVKLLAPDVVYPGQTVNMQVKVTDVNQKPVAGTDVTAYAYTAKFKNDYFPSIPSFGRQFTARKLNPTIEAEQLSLSGEMDLNWDKWAKALKLDTIEYYRFSQTKDLYVIKEGNDEADMAVVAPFVVMKGAVVPVHIIYIDHVPVYFSQADQLQRYAFRLMPGKYHIEMRTATHLVSLDSLDLEKGKKTIISIAADLKNTKAKVTVQPTVLSKGESVQLSTYMIGIENNFNGDKTTITADSIAYPLHIPAESTIAASRYGMPLNPNGGRFLVGPFAQNYLNFKSGKLDQTFIKEPGYNYTFLPGLLKQKSYPSEYGFNTDLTGGRTTDDYKQYPLKKGEADSLWNEYLDLRSRTTHLFVNNYGYRKDYGRITMALDTSMSNKLPYLKNILIYKYDEPDFLQVYPGNTADFNSLEKGVYRILYLFKDNRYCVAERVIIKAAGVNYFKWKELKVNAADQLSKQIDQHIKSVNVGKNSTSPYDAQLQILNKISAEKFDPSILTQVMTGKIVDGEDKSVISAAVISIKGLSYKTVSTADGRFEIKVPKRGKIIISFIGYNTQEVDIVNGDVGSIELQVAPSSLNEVVVVGYGTQKKKSLTGSVQAFFAEGLSGRVAGVSIDAAPAADLKILIRGAASATMDQKPLVIVDGIPYSGDISKLDPNIIASMDVLKGSEATAIYGSKAANGVFIIKTKGGNAALTAGGELVQQAATIRKNFSDYAIWQPRLFTDAEGKAAFTVKFPDDITNWTTQLIAINGRKQAGIGQTSIRSFKTLSANFVSPLFALAGDSIKVIGKLMNYNNIEETVNRKFSYNGVELLNGKVSFKNAKIDTVGILAKGGGFKMDPNHVNIVDSLVFEYTMKQENGYFDGEIRKIPMLQAGVTETKGFFNAFTRDTTITYQFDAKLGKVQLRAEASLFPTLLDEMEKIRNYEYLCNEQLASKLKALLLEKKVRKYLGEPFKEEKNIKEILKKLQNNRLPEGTWGWWQNSTEELWISLHVVESLLEAEQQGYPIALDKDKLYRYLVDKIANQQNFDQIYGIRLLNILNEKYYLKDWIVAVEKKRTELEERNKRDVKANSNVPILAKQPLYEQLQLIQLKQKAGMEIDLKWLMDLKSETMFGNIYWGENGSRFWDNSIQNTLLAYQILKANGGYKNELDRIQRYFLEQRKDGQWRNTYESSLILETILPELMASPGKKYQPASLVFNQTETITAFPFDKVVEPVALTLNKKGDAPVYFTAYQQFNNPSPEKISKDFTVQTSFEQSGTPVQKLKAGTLATLTVKVNVRADADYVMIEIPVPAGCSYENKMQSFWGVETHREYFKNKTSIFCTKLKKGNYTFNVQLMPRYSGNYILNPAKAEMMYFPIFYGREEMKRVAIN